MLYKIGLNPMYISRIICHIFDKYLFQLKTEAIEAYKCTLDLEPNSKDLILKVIELMLDLPIGDPDRTRYWVEQGSRFFPKNKSVQRLRVKMEDAKNLIDAGTGASSIVTR